jgi:hypothetical protein
MPHSIRMQSSPSLHVIIISRSQKFGVMSFGKSIEEKMAWDQALCCKRNVQTLANRLCYLRTEGRLCVK